MAKKVMILMRGVPGSGKSHLARRLAGRLGGKLFSADEWLMAGEDYIWTSPLVFAAHQINQQLVQLAMHRGEGVVIVDNTNIRPRQARPYVDLARKYKYEIEVREPNTPWRHDLQELLARGTHAMPYEAIEHMLETWKNVPISMFKKVLEIP